VGEDSVAVGSFQLAVAVLKTDLLWLLENLILLHLNIKPAKPIANSLNQ
jgi:hypothetical protein